MKLRHAVIVALSVLAVAAGIFAIGVPGKVDSERGYKEMRVFFTSPRLRFSEQFRGGIQEGLIHEMVGDIQRMKACPELGFQIPQEIPVSVLDAYERLVSLGFDKHLIAPA